MSQKALQVPVDTTHNVHTHANTHMHLICATFMRVIFLNLFPCYVNISDMHCLTRTPHTHPPVGVEAGDGLAALGVQRLGLLQQDALHQPGDVQVNVAGNGVQAGRVGAHRRQQVGGPGDLLAGLAVVGHFHNDPAERERDRDRETERQRDRETETEGAKMQCTRTQIKNMHTNHNARYEL